MHSASLEAAYENSAKTVKAEYITKRRYDEKSMHAFRDAFRDELSTELVTSPV